jgi:hypothetical protein
MIWRHANEWLSTWLGLVIRFLGLLQIVTTTVSWFYAYNKSLKHALSLCCVFIRCPVTASNNIASLFSKFSGLCPCWLSPISQLGTPMQQITAMRSPPPLSLLVEVEGTLRLTVGQSVSMSWCRAPLWGPWPDFTFPFLLPVLGRPLWREDRSVICSAICQQSVVENS